MNIVTPNTHHSLTTSSEFEAPMLLEKRLTDSDLIIDFNALDVSSTFDDSSSCFLGKDKTQRSSQAKPEVKKSKEQAIDDATATTIATSTSYLTLASSKNKRVSFGSLTIHEHAVELGISGVPRTGPAISIGWEAESSSTIESVETYEEARPCVPRKGIEMLQPKKQRVNILLESGYTLNQIRSCSQECDDIRNNRTKTVQQVKFGDKTKKTLKKLAVWKTKKSSSNNSDQAEQTV